MEHSKLKSPVKRKTKPRIEIDLAKVEKLAKVCDNEEELADALGISYSTLQNRKREFEDFKTAIKKGKASAHMFVKGKLMSLIDEGNVTAIIFYLKTRCGWKETTKTEVSGEDGKPLQVTFVNDLKD